MESFEQWLAGFEGLQTFEPAFRQHVMAGLAHSFDAGLTHGVQASAECQTESGTQPLERRPIMIMHLRMSDGLPPDAADGGDMPEGLDEDAA